MKTAILITIITAISIVSAILTMNFLTKDINLSGTNQQFNVFYAPSTSSGHGNVWASSTAYTISKNSNRQYFAISVFPYSTSTVWIWQNTSTDYVATGKGIPLNASSTQSFFEIDSSNLYAGEIQLISDGDTRVSWFTK